jgi:hypothetical protein
LGALTPYRPAISRVCLVISGWSLLGRAKQTHFRAYAAIAILGFIQWTEAPGLNTVMFDLQQLFVTGQ